MSKFADKVKSIVRDIPAGAVLTYSEVAKKAGSAKAARAVANLMAKNYDPTIPCHRVVRSDGSLGGYNRGGVEEKRALLIKEGYNFKQYGSKYIW